MTAGCAQCGDRERVSPPRASTYDDPYRWNEPTHHRQANKPPAPSLETEANPVVGRILGPSGDLVKVVRARAEVPFGFQGALDAGR